MHMKNMRPTGRKLEVLKFIDERGTVIPADLAYRVCPSIKCSYVYLLKLYRQGLLFREPTARGIFYRITPRGRERLAFLSRQSSETKEL